MSAAANQPPPDIDALEARLAAAIAERDTAIIERDAALRQNDRLAHLLRQLQRMQFGRKSEQLDPDQFALALEDVEQVGRGQRGGRRQAEQSCRIGAG